MTLRHSRFHWCGCFPAAVSLTLAGCASGNLADRGFKTVQVAYQYTDQNRAQRENSALLVAQDECSLDGFQYAQVAGPPKDVEPSRAVMTYYCIGIRY